MPPHNEANSLVYSNSIDNLSILETNSVQKEFAEDDHFQKSLYKNSKVYRLVLGDQVAKQQKKIVMNKWYMTNFKLVTEMGLPALDNSKHIFYCQVLQQKTNENGFKYYSTSTELSIEYNHYVDSWKNPGEFDIEYRFISTDASKVVIEDFFYIQIYLETQKALSLCLGPFQQQENQQQMMKCNSYGNLFTTWGDDDNKESYNIYRAIPLVDESRYCLLQEVWENGTPGKLWDSAVVMNNIIIQLFKSNNTILSNQSVLDLSAGVGLLGLTIAQCCQMYKVENPPHIVLTDLEEALPLIERNQDLNNISDLSIQTLTWGASQEISKVITSTPKGYFDLIFVSDVLYNACDFPALISTLEQLTFEHKETVVYFGYKPRGLKKSEEDYFFKNCAIYFDISTLSLTSFIQELDSNCHFNTNNILEETAVCIYKFIRK